MSHKTYGWEFAIMRYNSGKVVEVHFSISFFWFWFRCWLWVCYLDVYSCTLSIYSIIFKVVTASCLTYTLGSNFWSSKACHILWYVNQSNVNQNFTESKVGPSRSSSCTIFNNFFRRQQDWNIWKCFCWLRWFAGLKTRMIPRKIYKKSFNRNVILHTTSFINYIS